MIPTLFFIFLGCAVLGVAAAIINMLLAMKNFNRLNMNSMRNTIGIHFICGFFYVVGGIGAFVTGIMWIVTYLKAA